MKKVQFFDSQCISTKLQLVGTKTMERNQSQFDSWHQFYI